MFEPWFRELYASQGLGVRELYVRTLDSGTLMFEPRVRELPFKVRTLGSGTLRSNPGFGELYVRTLGLYVRTLGSGTLRSNPGFEHRVHEHGVRTLEFLNPDFEH